MDERQGRVTGSTDEIVIPIVEEEAHIGKRVVETGRVRVSTQVRTHEHVLTETLARSGVEIERVRIDREVEAVPAVREEGDLTVIPIVEEVLVVEKRLVLREEVRIRRTHGSEAVSQPVTVRSTEAIVERLPAAPRS